MREKWDVWNEVCVPVIVCMLTLILAVSVISNIAQASDLDSTEYTTQDLREAFAEAIYIAECMMVEEDSPTKSGCLEYILNLCNLIIGQCDVMDAVDEYGEPDTN